ncbi:hypothetical protein CBL_02443 [Carabus blaptoides fortunei]
MSSWRKRLDDQIDIQGEPEEIVCSSDLNIKQEPPDFHDESDEVGFNGDHFLSQHEEEFDVTSLSTSNRHSNNFITNSKLGKFSPLYVKDEPDKNSSDDDKPKDNSEKSSCDCNSSDPKNFSCRLCKAEFTDEYLFLCHKRDHRKEKLCKISI